MIGESKQVSEVARRVHVLELSADLLVDIGDGGEADEVGDVGAAEVVKPLVPFQLQNELEIEILQPNDLIPLVVPVDGEHVHEVE